MIRTHALGAIVALTLCSQIKAERVPDRPEDATHVVTGTVKGVYQRETKGSFGQEIVGYIVEIEVSNSERPETVKASDVLLVHCFQRKPWRGPGLVPPGADGHTAIPEEGQQIRAMALHRRGKLQALYPDWFIVIEPKKLPENVEPKHLVDKVRVEKSGREPTLKLPEAVQIATAHLKEERIDLSGHFLESIRLTEVVGKNGSYWMLTWVPSRNVIGGEIWVQVSMDRRLTPTIEHGR